MFQKEKNGIGLFFEWNAHRNSQSGIRMALFSLYYSLCIAEGVKTRWNVFIQSKGRWPTQAISQKKGGVNQRLFFCG